MRAATHPPAAAVAVWIHSITGRAQTKTDWNMTSMTAANTSIPQKRCVNTRSMRSVAVIRWWPGSTTTPSSTRPAQA